MRDKYKCAYCDKIKDEETFVGNVCESCKEYKNNRRGE